MAAAKRVIVDVMQVLASFEDCLVLVGGWVPDLVIGETDEAHVGSIDVDLDFLAPSDVKTTKNKPKLIEEFLVLKADGCEAAFHSPLTMKLSGQMIGGAKNTVSLRVASVPDFLMMKSIALAKRDKPKDAYDICYCLDHFKGGIPQLARAWRSQMVAGSDVARSVEILKEKFESVDSYGPMQVVDFHHETDESVREEQSRRAFELVRRFLAEIEQSKNDE